MRAIAPSPPLQYAQKYIFNKKNAPNVFIFYPRTQLVRLTTAVQGLGVPLREVPKTNPGYASCWAGWIEAVSKCRNKLYRRKMRE